MCDINYRLRVLLLMTQRGQTQENLAREFEVTVGTLKGRENGRHRPAHGQPMRLEHRAETFGITALVSSTPSAAPLAATSSTRITKGKSDG